MVEESLNPTEQRILAVMVENTGYHSTKEIGELAQVSWNTAQKYLVKFLELKWIENYQSGNREYWRATPPKGDKKK